MSLVSKHQSYVGLDGASFYLLLEPNAMARQTSEHHLLPRPEFSIRAEPCSPETPVSELDNYTASINQYWSRLGQILNGTPAGSLLMGTFANEVNAFVGYFKTIPSDFCIGPENQSAFNRLNSAIDGISQTIQRGDSMFEANLSAVFNRAVPLLNDLKSTSDAIGPPSRDFTAPITAARRYDDFVKPLQLDIWYLTPGIKNMDDQWSSLSHAAAESFSRALAQIETNVEAAARMFDDQNTQAETAFKAWDTVSGKDGYVSYAHIVQFVAQVLIPDFNAFLAKVPPTARVKKAADQAQQAINHIDNGFDSFPDFRPLPPDSSGFPHSVYGPAEKQYGEDKLINALTTVAVAYNHRTGLKLLIGNMQWEHGGYMSPHVSHKNGLDADVVGSDVGIVGSANYSAAKALALAKEMLSANATLVLFGDQNVVNDANTWAGQNNVAGHLSYDPGHKDHFHMRMPI